VSFENESPEDRLSTTGVSPDWTEVYELLKRRARALLNQKCGVDRNWLQLTTTSLVAEVWIKQRDRIEALHRLGEDAFYGVLYHSMLQVLSDYRRSREAQKRKPPDNQIPLDSVVITDHELEAWILQLDFLMDIETSMPELAVAFRLLFQEGQEEAAVADRLREKFHRDFSVRDVKGYRRFLLTKLKDLERPGRA